MTKNHCQTAKWVWMMRVLSISDMLAS